MTDSNDRIAEQVRRARAKDAKRIRRKATRKFMGGSGTFGMYIETLKLADALEREAINSRRSD